MEEKDNYFYGTCEGPLAKDVLVKNNKDVTKEIRLVHRNCPAYPWEDAKNAENPEKVVTVPEQEIDCGSSWQEGGFGSEANEPTKKCSRPFTYGIQTPSKLERCADICSCKDGWRKLNPGKSLFFEENGIEYNIHNAYVNNCVSKIAPPPALGVGPVKPIIGLIQPIYKLEHS